MVCDDEQRVQRFLSGDQEAFREIVDVYKAYVFAIILNFVKQQDEAENVAQEVFMQIYRSLPQYRFQSFKSWIGKIATTKAIDWQRKQAKLSREEPRMDLLEIIGTGGTHTPEEILLQEEKQKRVWEVCRELPAAYRRTIIKFYLEGKSYQQIAQEEGTTVKTVESRLYRARSIFKERWGGG